MTGATRRVRVTERGKSGPWVETVADEADHHPDEKVTQDAVATSAGTHRLVDTPSWPPADQGTGGVLRGDVAR